MSTLEVTAQLLMAVCLVEVSIPVTLENIGSRQSIVGTGIIISLGLQNLSTLLSLLFYFL